MSRLDECRLISLPEIADPRGHLMFVEESTHTPFPIKRVFFLYDVPADGVRGGHAHHEMQQLMIALAGKFDVVLDDGWAFKRFQLNDPKRGLYIAPMVWRKMERFSANAVMAVLASTPYTPDDYIRDHAAFVRMVEGSA
jgi:dTDP-4-dehydrorhamnose 3,5-epimerase-like enzyme